MHKKILPPHGMSKTNFNDFDEYQRFCKSVAVYPSQGKNINYTTLGLLGESGEIANKLKKIIRDHRGKLNKERKNEIFAELGDVLWYVAMMSYELGFKFSELAKENVEKLSSRHTRGKVHGSGDNR